MHGFTKSPEYLFASNEKSPPKKFLYPVIAYLENPWQDFLVIISAVILTVYIVQQHQEIKSAYLICTYHAARFSKKTF